MITTVRNLLLNPARTLFMGAVLGLAACGTNEREVELGGIIKDFGTRVLTKEDPANQQAPLQVTRAQVDVSKLPVIRVRLEGTGATSILIEVDRKGPNATFKTADGITLMFRAGVLIGTRGLGQDLMALAAPDIRQAVRAGETSRDYRYLDGDEHLATVTLSCHVTSEPHAPLNILGHSHAVNLVREQCSGTNLEDAPVSFENFYWVAPNSSQIWQSRQYVSEKFGRAEIEVLKAR